MPGKECSLRAKRLESLTCRFARLADLLTQQIFRVSDPIWRLTPELLDCVHRASRNSEPGSGTQMGAPHQLLQFVPDPATASVLIQVTLPGQPPEMLLEGIAAHAGQFDGIAHGDAAVFTREFHDLQ